MSDGIAPGSLAGSYREVPPQATPDAPKFGATKFDATKSDATKSDATKSDAEFSDSLQFVRDVAERVRDAQNRSGVAVSEAREAARRAIVAMWQAEERAAEAETRLAAAVARADEADEQLRLLRSQRGGDEPVATGVDRWLNEAYLQLRLASESAPTRPQSDETSR